MFSLWSQRFRSIVITLPWWEEPDKNGSLVAGTGWSYVTYCFNVIQQMQPYRLRRVCLLCLSFFSGFPSISGKVEREWDRALLRDIRRLICYYPFGIMACSNWAQILLGFFFFFFHSLHNDYAVEWEMAPARTSGILSTSRFRCTCLLGQGGCGLPAFPVKVVAIFFPFPVTNQPKSSACEEVSPF